MGTGSERSDVSTILIDATSQSLTGSSEVNPVVGARRGRYILLDELGRGGMGIVMRAYDPRLGREVALKLLRHLDDDETATARLMREAQAMAKLDHPNVVSVFDVELDEQGLLLAMELVRGQSLREWLYQGHRWQDVVRAYLDAGRGLAAAHAAGLVHRDFKPSNVLVGEDGRVRVTDFGLARQVGEPGPDDGHLSGSYPSGVLASGSFEEVPVVDTDLLTEAGMVMGTIPYMAPEQMRATATDARTDQYALCVALWHGLCGERPFSGDRNHQQRAKAHGPPPWPKDSSVPRRLQDAVRRGLRPNPEDRWPELDPLLQEMAAALRRGPRPWMYAGVGVVLLVGGVAVGRFAGETEAHCDGGPERFAEVWNDDLRRQVQVRMEAIDKAYAPQTWTRVEASLDAYRDDWLEAYRDACEASHLRNEQSAEMLDRRMACLDRRHAATQATLDVLAEVDETMLPKAVPLVSGLPSPADCGDLERLVADVPPPEDPAVAELVEGLRGEIEAVHALRRAGRIELAEQRANELVASAEPVPYPPLRAEALLARGRLLAEIDDQKGARSDLETAVTLAIELDLQEVATWAAASLTYIVGQRQNEPNAGLAWGTMALAMARRHDAGGRTESFVEQNLGALYIGLSRFDEAEVHCQAALELRERLDGPDSLELGPMLNNLGNLRVSQGRYDEGYDYLERALQVREAGLGRDHPYVGIVLLNMTAVLMRMKDLDRAETMARRGIDNVQLNYGPDHPRLAVAKSNLGSVLTEGGRTREGLELFREAIAIYERTDGDNRRDLTIAMSNSAAILANLGETAKAEAEHRKILAIREALPEHPHLVNTLRLLAKLRLDAGDTEEATSLHQRAMDIASRVLPEGHPDYEALAELRAELETK